MLFFQFGVGDLFADEFADDFEEEVVHCCQRFGGSELGSKSSVTGAECAVVLVQAHCALPQHCGDSWFASPGAASELPSSAYFGVWAEAAP